MDHKETYDKLYEAGFTMIEIDCLQRLRQDYAEERAALAALERRLEFVRWLVITGKLTEQIA
jgi:hypothetical protein